MSDSPLAAFSSALADAIALASPGVVAVQSHRALSSGLAWRDDLVVTSDEALAEEGAVSVTLAGGEQRPATVAGRDATTAIALLWVEGGGLTPVPLDAGPVRAGELALAVGAREGAALAAFGVVAVAGPGWRSMRGGEIASRIELDMQLRRQAEGGLVVDATGRGIGMAVFGPRRRVLVIPAATIERVATRLASHGRIARGYLGLGMRPVQLDGGKEAGVMVMGVDSGGPGDTAGVRQGDVIVAWNGALIGMAAMLRALGPDSVGSVVTLGLRRAGQPIDVAVTVGERPAG